MQWWMFRQQMELPSVAVQRVLEQLKQAGVVHERKTASGRALYFASQQDEGASEERFPSDGEGPERSRK